MRDRWLVVQLKFCLTCDEGGRRFLERWGAMIAIPPTIPPAVAPVLLELELLWSGLAVAVLDELEEIPETPAAMTVT